METVKKVAAETSEDARLEILKYLESIAQQGLEIASLKRQLCLVQLEKIQNERTYIAQKNAKTEGA